MKNEEEILKALYEIKKDVEYIKDGINSLAVLLGKIKEIKDYMSSKEFKKLQKELEKYSG